MPQADTPYLIRTYAPRPQDRDEKRSVTDLLEVAKIEPRAVPADLAKKLTRDHDKSVAALAIELLSIIKDVGEDGDGGYYGPFGM